MVENLSKSRNTWERLSIILGQEGANPLVLGMFLNLVVQKIFLFGSEMWVMTPCMSQDLGGGGGNPAPVERTGGGGGQGVGSGGGGGPNQSQGVPTDYREAASEASGQELGAPHIGGGDTGGGV